MLGRMTREADLPLRYQTAPAWAAAVLDEPLANAERPHLEKKAASNALELLNRWPEPNPPENWVAAMTAVARDEVEHLSVVSRCSRGAAGADAPARQPVRRRFAQARPPRGGKR